MGQQIRHKFRDAMILNLWAKEAPAKEIVAAVELAKKIGTLPERTPISVWIVYRVAHFTKNLNTKNTNLIVGH